jgi:lipopolysaccharide biosynthesis glycosyltransferase
MLENASPNYKYVIKILNSGINADNVAKIKKYERDNVSIEFVNVCKSLEELGLRLHTCIYYTQVTYYRLFIPTLYPQFDKALYLDPDIVVRGDISKLFNINIGNNLVGATTDEFVINYEKVHDYITKGLGINKLRDYFNAGILIMNLKEMRRQNFEDTFVDLLTKYKFIVQDQDYLNVICKNQVHYISGMWDKMPCVEDVDISKINIIHYNLIWKPWHAEVPYGEEFWYYVDKTEYKDVIHGIRDNYSVEKYKQDVANFEGFMDKIVEEANNPNNYNYTYVNTGEDEGDEVETMYTEEVMA